MKSFCDALTLAHGDILRISDSRGLLVHVAQGSIWLTEEGDRRDIVLGPDQAYRLERDGLALVYALEPVALTLFAARPPQRAALRPSLGLVPARAAT